MTCYGKRLETTHVGTKKLNHPLRTHTMDYAALNSGKELNELISFQHLLRKERKMHVLCEKRK